MAEKRILDYFKYNGRERYMNTVETELKVSQCGLDVHMECTPFVND